MTLDVEETGQGPMTVLAIPGSPAPRASLAPLLARLSEGARVLAVELPGIGEAASAGPPRPLEETRRALAALLRERAAGPAVLIGHSFGCWRAFDLALNTEAQVAGIVGLAPLARLDGRARSSMRSAARALRDNTLSTAAVAARWFGARWREDPTTPDAERTARAWIEASPAEHAARDLDLSAAAPDLLDALAQLTQPVLLRVGAEDTPTPLAWAEAIARRLPDARLEVVADAGHFIHLEDAAATAASVLAFIAARSRDVSAPRR